MFVHNDILFHFPTLPPMRVVRRPEWAEVLAEPSTEEHDPSSRGAEGVRMRRNRSERKTNVFGFFLCSGIGDYVLRSKICCLFENLDVNLFLFTFGRQIFE